jgi:transcriptional regulator with XRE-family HTH domain
VPALPDDAWLERREHLVSDDAGDRLRQWRLLAGRSQESVAAALGMTQQHLSQVEHGKRPLSIAQRRRIVAELGVAWEDMGLVQYTGTAADDTTGEVAASAGRWRAQRHWLNQHRAELAQLAVAIYPEEHRIPGTTLIADPRWIPASPLPLRSLALELDEQPRPVAVDGSESDTLRLRPLRSPTQHDDRYTAAVRRIDPPRLFESRPSYRLLNVDLDVRKLRFGMAAYFDKLDVSEALGHEMALMSGADVESGH